MPKKSTAKPVRGAKSRAKAPAIPRDKLALGARGSDVASLHQRLSARGFTISPEEATARRFGPVTRAAVKAFQILRGFDATGRIDQVTEAAMAAETGAPSEFARLFGNVTARLGRAGIARLKNRKRDELARETGIDRARLDMLAQAVTLRERIDRLGRAEPDRPAETVSAETEIVYGLLRAGALANPEARSASDLAVAVKGSIESGVVSSTAEEAARGLLYRLNRIAVLLPSETTRASLGDALATLPHAEQLTEDQSVQFVTLYTAFGAGAPLWTAVEASDLGARLKPLKRTVALQELTGSFAPMMRALQTFPGATADDTGAFLAAVRPNEWRELARANGAPEGETPLAYAERLQTTVERRYPAVALRARLEKGDVKIDRVPADHLATFLARHADFDFNARDFDIELKNRGANDEELRGALAAIRRTLGMAGGRIDASAVLINAGLDSSFAIANLGPSRFQGRMRKALPGHVIAQIQKVADEQVLTGVAVGVADWTRSRVPKALPIGDALPVMAGGPTLRTLFGDMDLCECSHCRSVLGPAAYLADLLHFLETSSANDEGSATVLDGLAARRPDLRHLELSCENTNTEIPYTDLVLETLENVVALPLRVAAAAQSTTIARRLMTGNGIRFDDLPEQVKDALRLTSIMIGETVSVEHLKASGGATILHDWAISDGSRRWELSLRPEQIKAWRELKGGPQAITVGGFDDPAAVLNALTTQNQLHQELVNRLAPSREMPVKSNTVTTGVLTPTGKQGWRAVIIREFVLKFPPFGNGAVKFIDAANQTLRETDILDNLTLSLAQEALNAKIADPTINIGTNPFWSAAIGKLDLPVPIDRTAVTVAALAPGGQGFVGSRYKLTSPESFLLEVIGSDLTVTALAYQNSSILSHLEARPENRDPEAYRRLSAASFPWTLPFDLPLEETRALLEKLGVSRRMLLEIALPDGPMTDRRAAEILGLSPSEASIIAPPPGAAVAPIWEVWGIGEVTNRIWDEHAGIERTGSWSQVLSRVSMVMQQARLSHRELLDQLQTLFMVAARPTIMPDDECEPSKLTLAAADLASSLDLVHRFIRLWRRTGWTMREIDRALVVFAQTLDGPALRGIALIQVLHERLRIPIVNLVAMLGSLEIASWKKNTSEGAPVEPSLYDQLFRQSALRGSPSFERFALDGTGRLPAPTFNANGDPAPSDTVVAHAPFIASAVGLSPEEVVALSQPKDVISFASLSSLLGTATFSRALKLTIKDYLRWVAILGGQAPMAVLGGAARAEALLRFADQIGFARRSGKSLEEIEYLLLHVKTGTFRDADERIAQGVTDLHKAFRAGEVLGALSASNLSRQLLRAGAPAPLANAVSSGAALDAFLWAEIELAIPAAFNQPDFPVATNGRFYCEINPSRTRVRFGCRGFVDDQSFDALEQAPAANVAIAAADRRALRARYGLVRSILASQLQNNRTVRFEAPVAQPRPAVVMAPDLLRFLDYDQTKGLILTGLLTAAQATTLKAELPASLGPALDDLVTQSNAFANPADPAVALAAFEAAHALGTNAEADALERALCLLVSWLELDLLSSETAAFSGLTQPFCRDLLGLITVSGGATAEAALSAPAFLSASGAGAAHVEQIEALTRLRKTALLLVGTPIENPQLPWLFGRTFTLVDVNQLPAKVGDAPLSFTGWRAFRELLQAGQAIEAGFTILDQLGAAIAATDAVQRNQVLKNAFELADEQSVADACAADLLNLQWADLKDPHRLLQLFSLLNLSRLMGTAPAQLKHFIAPMPDEDDAALARQVFMSRFDSETVPARMEQVSNVLRARQRDALIDYLRSKDRLRQVDDLLDYYLIDVQMGTCLRTSRIKQAISSVQLFVQRCLLGLERRAALPVWPEHINERRWKWMQNYRVWEANRKVFLFPENWIEPDLRDDKTEIFRAFESELLQEDLTQPRAIAAFRSYVEGLAEVARPVIVSTWHEVDADGRRRMHVAARDRGTPHKFYYRRAVLTPGLGVRWTVDWTPWERIDAEFPSGHIMICEMDGIVYLLSPAINRDDQNGWKIHMEALRRTEAGWVALKKSLDAFTHVIVPNKSIAQSFVFRPLQVASTFGKTVQVLCFRAIVKENERVTLRNAGNLTVTSPPPFMPNAPQSADLWIRIVDHFKDPANQNADTYQQSDTGFRLAAQFEVKWFYRDITGAEQELSPAIDQAAWDRAFTFNDGIQRMPTTASTTVSKAANVFETVNLTNLMDNSVNAAIQAQSARERPILTTLVSSLTAALLLDTSWVTPAQWVAIVASLGAALPGFATAEAIARLANAKAPIYFRVVRISSMEIRVDVPDADKSKLSNTTFVQQIPLQTYNNSGSIELDFVLNYKDGEVPLRASPDRQLEFERAGAFQFDESRALIYLTPDQLPLPHISLLKDPPFEGTEYFDSGFLRRPPARPPTFGQFTPLRLRSQNQTVLTDSSNGFFVAKANGPDAGWEWMRPLGAYSDSSFVLYFIASEDRYFALPNGSMWVWSGLRELGTGVWDTGELERMPALVSGAAAARIPYQRNSTLIDFQASPATVDLAYDRALPDSNYDWEAFFHAPLLIAMQLSQGQRFEEARLWFHTIFDPTSDHPAPQNVPLGKQEAVRYWRFPPFREAALQELEVDDLLEAYAKGTLAAVDRARLEANIQAWKDQPFSPHLIARSRVRSYMWAVIIKYAQNHLAWADQLYRRDTLETINQATQLYVLVARLLGPRPQSSPRPATPAHSYAYLAGPLMDQLSNVWLQWETLAPAPTSGDWVATDPASVVSGGASSALLSIATLYFCIPQNAELLALWDLVEDRLFKIRHCMNIEGVERRLPLFEPPIDPGLLVRAVAAGLDIEDVIAGLGAPLPHHRFSVMIAKAIEVCGDLRSVGAAALSALEKRDAEELALLRSGHEIGLLKLTEQVRKQQIDEADMTLQGLAETRRTAEERLKHYQRLLDRSDFTIPEAGATIALTPIVTPLAKTGLDGKEQGLGVSQTELDQITLIQEARAASLRAGVANTIGGVLLAIGGILSASPRGSSPGPILGNLGGGLTGAGQGFNAAASAYQAVSSYLSGTASIDAIIGGYERRRDDWIFQSNMALREIAQIDKQAAAATIRKEIAHQELENVRTQIDNAKSVQDFFKSKYSSAQLYRYMSNQLVTLYYRSHQLALDVAKRAERCFQIELAQPSASFIKPTYWDATRKGLLSGEQLHFDLRRMDVAYLESHRREHELTRHVSIQQIDPVALIALRQTGRCEFRIPELLYDMDCPGHYLRRIKSVSVTVPCIAGPYTGIHCKLTLLSSSVRKDPTGQDYARTADDPRFVDDFSAIQSIVTSAAQNDPGLFESNLRDERYLPFEGAGAISSWRLELPSRVRQIDYDSINDVVLHVRYTARDGGGRLRELASLDVEERLGQLAPVRLFSIRHDFPTEWTRFKHKQGANDLVLKFNPEHYSFWTRGAGPKTARGASAVSFANDVMLFASKSGNEGTSPQPMQVQTVDVQGRPCKADLKPDMSQENLLIGTLTLTNPGAMTDRISMDAKGEWKLNLDTSIEDLWIAVVWGGVATGD